MSKLAREFEYTLKDFNVLRKITNAHTGIVVRDEKFDMFYSRLANRLRVLNLTSFKDYICFLKSPLGADETIELVNAVTTNLTFFFRENYHFENLAKIILPEIMAKNRAVGKIDIWSAGCATGEEPYSIAMTLREAIPDHESWDITITATDINSKVLATAASGVYRDDLVDGLSKSRLHRFFERGKGDKAGYVRIKPEIRKLVRFSQSNLIEDWRMSRMDLIFCRNVIIYFDAKTKAALLDRYANVLKDGGYLFLGHSETLHKLTGRFKLIGKTIYQKVK